MSTWTIFGQYYFLPGQWLGNIIAYLGKVNKCNLVLFMQVLLISCQPESIVFVVGLFTGSLVVILYCRPMKRVIIMQSLFAFLFNKLFFKYLFGIFIILYRPIHYLIFE